MQYTPISPFKRPLTPAHLSERAPCPVAVDKWVVLRNLTAARHHFGLKERVLTVLQGLLSFHPKRELAGDTDIVVFPSNLALSERLNGMALSTLRRHLAKLVALGLILRRDSPNGKRYRRKAASGEVAFGFDLSPLPRRFAEIEQAAAESAQQAARIAQLRETVSLMRRDLLALVDFANQHGGAADGWDAATDLASLTARSLRRKLSEGELLTMQAALAEALETANKAVDMRRQTENPSTSDAEIGRHYQNSNKEHFESESAKPLPEQAATPDRKPPALRLNGVLSSCPEIQAFSDEPIHQWGQFCAIAAVVRKGMGIDDRTWQHARECLGEMQSSVVVAAMLERFSQIRSPGAYLRQLANKASAGRFTVEPMLAALGAHRAVT